jgi:hypothetical protein
MRKDHREQDEPALPGSGKDGEDHSQDDDPSRDARGDQECSIDTVKASTTVTRPSTTNQAPDDYNVQRHPSVSAWIDQARSSASSCSPWEMANVRNSGSSSGRHGTADIRHGTPTVRSPVDGPG